MVLFEHPSIAQNSFREALCLLKSGAAEEDERHFSDEEIRQALIGAGFAETLGEAALDLIQNPGDGSLGRIQVARDGLSFPQLQMLQIAKALLHKPQVLILDNATSALSTEGVERTYTLLQYYRPKGITISFSDVHNKLKMPFHNKVASFDPGHDFIWTVIERAPAIPATPVIALPPPPPPPPPRPGALDNIFDWLRNNW